MKMKFALILGIVMVISLFVSFVQSNNASPTVTEKEFIVHEWGTFTSIYGSDGTLLPGIHLDEEALPQFVYAHDLAPGMTQLDAIERRNTQDPKITVMTKGFRRPVSNVTVKLETPVLYFYSPVSLDARVSVGFNGGSISQWYPARSGGESMPERFSKDDQGNKVVNAIDFAAPYRGAINWKFRVEPRTLDTDFEVMKPGELPNWIHPRGPKSNVLRTESGEAETYLFYRGLGNFEQPISYRVTDEKLHITATKDVPYLMVVDVQAPDYGTLLWKGNPEETETVSLEGLEASNFRSEIYGELKTALVEAGLYEDEASAMLRTWWHSYFGKPGLRAFWIVPRRFTDETLPIEIEPTPSQIERVLLGRSEILTPKFEERINAEFTKLDQNENQFRHDRYFPAFQARHKMLTKNTSKNEFIKSAARVRKTE